MLIVHIVKANESELAKFISWINWRKGGIQGGI